MNPILQTLLDMSGIAALLIAVATFLNTRATLIKSKKMTPHEIISEDSNAAKNFAEAADSMAKQNKQLQDELRKSMRENLQLKTSLDKINDRLSEIEIKYKKQDELIKRWTNGIKILTDQLCRVNEVPDWQPSFEDIDMIGEK